MRVLLSLLVVYGGMCLLAYLVSDGMIFQPPPATYEDTSRTLKLSSADGARISAVHLPHPPAAYTILYSLRSVSGGRAPSRLIRSLLEGDSPGGD